MDYVGFELTHDFNQLRYAWYIVFDVQRLMKVSQPDESVVRISWVKVVALRCFTWASNKQDFIFQGVDVFQEIIYKYGNSAYIHASNKVKNSYAPVVCHVVIFSQKGWIIELMSQLNNAAGQFISHCTADAMVAAAEKLKSGSLVAFPT